MFTCKHLRYIMSTRSVLQHYLYLPSKIFFVGVSQGRRLHESLNLAGVTSILLEVTETVHAFDQYFGVSRRFAPAAQTVTYDIERFLALMV